MLKQLPGKQRSLPMNHWRKLVMIFFMSCLGLATASAQQAVTVSGTVTSSADGETIPGVNIMVKGAGTGTVTDMDGEFSLTLGDRNAVLVVSSIGFLTQEVSVNNRSTIDISLQEDVKSLDEVVVIGYGEVKRRDLTGSVASVDAEDILKTPTHNALDAIKGRAPGVDITRSSGQAGSGVNITIRGNRSISGDNTPLYIIDGYQGGNIGDLNPNDIKSIEVLKDASATAIYGSQGANGVIIVTTKSGAAGETKVSYNAFYGVNGLTPFPAVRMGDNYTQLRREAYRTVGQWDDPSDDSRLFANAGEWDAVQNNRWVDWTDLVMRDGSQQSHTLSVSGGNEKTKAFFSGGYFREEGMLRGDDMTRYTGRFNVEHELSSWVKAGVLGQVAYFNQNFRSSPLSHAMTMSPFGEPYDEDGNINLNPIQADGTMINPLIDERSFMAEDNQIRTNIMFNSFVELTPIEGLKIRSNFGTNLTNHRRGTYLDAESFPKRNSKNTESRVTQGYNRFFNWDNIITYSKEFDDHGLTVTGITNYIQNDYDQLFGAGYGQALATQLFYNLGATETDSRLLASNYTGTNQMSYAGRIDYNYQGKYRLTLTNRYDGASRLAPGNKWASFPSIAAAWVMSDEAFLSDVSNLNFAKLRASYGVAGNSGIDPYGTQSVVNARTNLNFGGVPASYYSFSTRAGNAGLGWETTRTANIGLDFGFYDNRLKASVDMYQANTSDLLLLRNLPQSTGVLDIYQNVGETQNQGIEVMINSVNVEKRDFTWNSTLTFTRNREKITELIDGEDIIQNEDNSLLIGRPINSYFSYKKLGIWQVSEADEAAEMNFGGTPYQPGDIKVEDANGDGTINPEDRQYLGSNVPKFVLGFQNSFRYKAFDFSAFVFARWGQMINAEVLGRYNPSGERNGPAFMDYWTPENPTNDFPRPRRGASLSNYAAYQSLTFVDGSFIKLQNISIGYTLPKTIAEKLRLENLRLYATGNNLWTYAKNPMLREYDPERGGAESYPLNRQIVFGINVDF